MNSTRLRLLATFLPLLTIFSIGGAGISAVQDAPRKTPHVWIFAGTPGDEEHHALIESQLGRLRKTLTERFDIGARNLTVLYGPKSAGYDGVCTRENLTREIKRVCELSQDESNGPIWLILLGHANKTAAGSNFNLPGDDISAREFGRALQGAREGATIVLIATTTASDPFLRPVAAPGRLIITATEPKDIENETEFPGALIQALEDPDSDTDKDGLLSVTEIFLATRAHVLSIYNEEQLIIREHALLDGDGDGSGSRRPSRRDAEPASRIGLSTNGKGREFD